MNIVIFEGMSGSGKDSLQKSVAKLFDYNIITINRFTPSIWVYDSLRGFDRTDEIIKFEREFDCLMKPFLVISYCDPEISEKRDVVKENAFKYEFEKDKFEEYEKTICQYTRKIIIDTSINSVEECAKKIKREIDEKSIYFRK